MQEKAKQSEREPRRTITICVASCLLLVATGVWTWAISTSPEWPALNVEQDSKRKDLGSVRLRRWGPPQVCVSTRAEYSTPFPTPQTWTCKSLSKIQDVMRRQGLAVMDAAATAKLFGGKAGIQEASRRQSDVWRYSHQETAAKLAWVCTDRPSKLHDLKTAAALQIVALVATPILGIIGVIVATMGWITLTPDSFRILCGFAFMFLLCGTLLFVANALIASGHSTKCSPVHPSLEELGYTRDPTATIVTACFHYGFCVICAAVALVLCWVTEGSEDAVVERGRVATPCERTTNNTFNLKPTLPWHSQAKQPNSSSQEEL